MKIHDLPGFDVDDDDLRRRFETLADRAEMPILDPVADLRRAREARRRRRLARAGAGLVAAAAVSAVLIGSVTDADVDAGQVANSPTSTTSPFDDLRGVPNEMPDAEAFREHVGRVLGRPAPVTGDGAIVLYDRGETRLADYQFPWSDGVSLDIRAGVSREAVEWGLASDISEVFVGSGMAEKGSLPGGSDAYVLDQPDGDVVLVAIDGPSAQAPPDDVISTLLTDIDVPVSTLTPGEVWGDTMLSMGLDAFVDDDLSIEHGAIQLDETSVLAEVVQGQRETGYVRWHAQTLTPDTPDCPAGFTDCGTMQIGGENFLSKHVVSGHRKGWLYLERDHGDVRAQVLLEPDGDAWSLPLDAAAELLLDDRWSQLAPGSSVPYSED